MNRTEIQKMFAAGLASEAATQLRKDPTLLSARDEHGNALVHALLKTGDIRHCLDLVTDEVLETLGRGGWTTLHYAAAAGTLSLLAEPITKSCGRVFFWQDNRGDLAAHVAARAGHLDQFVELCPFQLAKRNNLGQTPLHFAAQFKHLDQVPQNFQAVLLLASNIAGRTPLSIAEENGSLTQLPAPLVLQAKQLAAKSA